MEPYAILMAGGAGTRFWPTSRPERPKQFLSIGTQVPLIRATADRLENLVPWSRILVVAVSGHRELVLESLPDLPPENLILEPTGRNTLPCLALANAEIRRRDPDSVQLVLPSDHIIRNTQALQESLREGVQLAASQPSGLVTLGVPPTFPSTGYGYIEISEEHAARGGACPILGFTEKPDRETAEQFLLGGKHLWNSGMFVWSTTAFTGALEIHSPEIWDALENADLNALDSVYPGLQNISVDVGIMEKASDRWVLPLTSDWSDIGSWSALRDIFEADTSGNISAGEAELISVDASNNIVHASAEGITALIGVEDLIVVHHAGNTLVCHKDREQDVKEVIARLDESGRAPS